jgi:hypothetical protein
MTGIVVAFDLSGGVLARCSFESLVMTVNCIKTRPSNYVEVFGAAGNIISPIAAPSRPHRPFFAVQRQDAPSNTDSSSAVSASVVSSMLREPSKWPATAAVLQANQQLAA